MGVGAAEALGGLRQNVLGGALHVREHARIPEPNISANVGLSGSARARWVSSGSMRCQRTLNGALRSPTHRDPAPGRSGSRPDLNCTGRGSPYALSARGEKSATSLVSSGASARQRAMGIAPNPHRYPKLWPISSGDAGARIGPTEHGDQQMDAAEKLLSAACPESRRFPVSLFVPMTWAVFAGRLVGRSKGFLV